MGIVFEVVLEDGRRVAGSAACLSDKQEVKRLVSESVKQKIGDSYISLCYNTHVLTAHSPVGVLIDLDKGKIRGYLKIISIN